MNCFLLFTPLPPVAGKVAHHVVIALQGQQTGRQLTGKKSVVEKVVSILHECVHLHGGLVGHIITFFISYDIIINRMSQIFNDMSHSHTQKKRPLSITGVGEHIRYIEKPGFHPCSSSLAKSATMWSKLPISSRI